jgi:N-acetylmuramoyl-L-alanine amidase
MNPLKDIPGKKKKMIFLSVAICVAAVVAATFFFLPKKAAAPVAKKENKVFTVIIDAGHGGRDEGTKFKTTVEKNITLAIAKQIEMLGPQYGLKVILTRHTDTFLNPIARVSFAMQQNADAYVSIHVNELRGYSYVSGMQVYVSNKNPDFEQSRILGSAIAQDLGADFKVSPRLQQRAENIFVLADNFMPSILIECGFITNPGDLKLLTDSTKTLLIAQQILNGVSAYAKHASINAYAVQIATPSAARHKNIIAANRVHLKKSHKRSIKTA